MTKHRTVPLQTYPTWGDSSLCLPLRSRLFRLAPVGVGTFETESLTSYIARLAVEHCVSPRALFCKEVLERVGERTVYYSDSPIFFGNAINGIGNLAETTVTTLELLTLRHDLRHTTLLTWRQVFSDLQLLRKRRSWRALCYEEQVAERGYAHEPLIWSFEAVSICNRHHEPLCQVCPYCGNQLIFLAKHYRPGYCSKCLRWLGLRHSASPNRANPTTVTSTELAKQVSVLNIVGELLSCAPTINQQPTQQTFLNNLARIIDTGAGHSINLFSDLVGVWSGKIRRLLAGATKLSIDTLCHFCFKLNLSPMDLLHEKEGEGEGQKPSTSPYLKGSIPKATTPWEEVASSLHAALQEMPPPSLEAVGRRLGYYPSKLKGHFPDLCEQIKTRFKIHIESKHPAHRVILRTLKSALEEEPPPSLQSVLRRLGCRDTGYYYYSHYFDLCAAITQRFKDHRNKPFDKKRTKEQLLAALKEDPPPSFSSVAKRLGHSREFFRQKYPKLTKAIASRHMSYRKNQEKEKAESLRRMIREAIKSILDSGLYASQARVTAYLQKHRQPVGRGSLFKQALREVKSKMNIGK